MKKILLIGAGRSTYSLVKYIQEQVESEDWQLTIADRELGLAESKAAWHERFRALKLDINQAEQRRSTIAEHDLVISMLPAHMHIEVARDCVALRKHMVTASYISAEMEALDAEARA